MVNLQELFPVADVVGPVVFGVGEDHQDAVGREVVHLAPEPRPNEQALRMGIEDDAFFTTAVEEAHTDGACHTYAELSQFLMRVEAAADGRLRAVDPIDAADRKREHATEFSDGELTAGVAALWDVDEVDEGGAHAMVLAESQRVTSGRIGRSTSRCTKQASTSVTTKHRAIAGRRLRPMALALNHGMVTSWTR